MLDVIIVIVLALIVLLALPRWSYSRSWGAGPASATGALLLAFVAFWYVLGPMVL